MPDLHEAVREALTVTCGRCNGRGKESWQVSSSPADGREDWPCVRCNGAGTVTDEDALSRVLAALEGRAVTALLSCDDCAAVLRRTT